MRKGKPPKFPKVRTLGVNNWIKARTAVNPKRWKMVTGFMRLVVKSGPYYRYPLLGGVLKKLMMFSPAESSYTQAYLLNLNEQIAAQSQGVIMPVKMIEKVIKESSYRAIMNRCICRDGNNCSLYPKDLGCIFLGEGARVLEQRGVGRSASIEQALGHVSRAAALGLVGQTLWIEVEQYIWGIRDQDMHRFLELCFCCPCCCTSLGLAKNVTPDVRKRFQSIGWKAEIVGNCTRCGVCVSVCPVGAPRCEGDWVTVRQDECLGCGLCAGRCPESAIRLRLVRPVLGDLKDYYAASGLRLDLGRGGDSVSG
ncbi:MAG: 4Fe-4S binding protein [candidate division KSB1 bacterium]|nr:4Fe-4S binding protein [candidate division KSB1 bacterium]